MQRNRMAFCAPVICTFLGAFVGVPDARAVTIEGDGFRVSGGSEVSAEAVELVADRVGEAIHLVSGFLSQSSQYRQPKDAAFVDVVIDPEKGPYQSGGTIYVPESRVVNLIERSGDGRTDLNIVHEITHVFAESFGRKDHDRFYDDGLAVYLQHRFGQETAYPNFGQDLYIAFARASAAHGEDIPLSESEAVRNAQRSGAGRKLAYLQEGAFTQYLIDRFGLDAYLRVFNGEGFEAVIGASMKVIEADWQNLMKTFAVVARLSEGG